MINQSRSAMWTHRCLIQTMHNNNNWTPLLRPIRPCFFSNSNNCLAVKSMTITSDSKSASLETLGLERPHSSTPSRRHLAQLSRMKSQLNFTSKRPTISMTHINTRSSTLICQEKNVITNISTSMWMGLQLAFSCSTSQRERRSTRLSSGSTNAIDAKSQ